LVFTRQLFAAEVWKRIRPISGIVIILAIAAPWHILATIRNPPYFDFTLRSVRGQYHGFFWFYFINEQLLRFLNLRYPRDYDTVPRLWFWLLHLVWLFPWSVYVPAMARQSFRPRAADGALLDRLHTDFLHVFDDARVLLHALLHGVRAAFRVGHGQRGGMDSRRNKNAGGSGWLRRSGSDRYFMFGVEIASAWRYCGRANRTSAGV